MQITVFAKEPFQWDIKKRPAGDPFKWTKEDEDNFGKMTVVGIKIFGDDDSSISWRPSQHWFQGLNLLAGRQQVQ